MVVTGFVFVVRSVVSCWMSGLKKGGAYDFCGENEGGIMVVI